MRDPRSLVIGLLLGVCVVLSMGQAVAPNPQRDRYDVSPSVDAHGNYVFFVHDREANRVYHRVFGNTEVSPEGVTVDRILQKN